MGKQYYCEYCCRPFQDNLTARKKHLNSLAHKRKREEWYRSFKDKKTIYYENLNKKPCNKYLSTGSCPYGNSCKYRHFRQDELQSLKNDFESATTKTDLPSGNEILRSWLVTRKKSSATNEVKSEVEVISDHLITPELELHQPLPPSLVPPPVGGWDFTCDDLVEWG